MVQRGPCAGNPDVLTVFEPSAPGLLGEDHGELFVFEPMQPHASRLGPRSTAEARQRPWCFTGSPFGPHLVGLLWERHAAGMAK